MATQADLDRLEAARIELAAGAAVQTVRYDGPPSRMVTFHPTDYDKLTRLIGEIRAELARAAGSTSYIYLATSKGLD